jgi:hypothetical protein
MGSIGSLWNREVKGAGWPSCAAPPTLAIPGGRKPGQPAGLEPAVVPFHAGRGALVLRRHVRH